MEDPTFTDEGTVVDTGQYGIEEMDVDSIRAKYPHWTDEMVLDLKAQFQSFDLVKAE